MSWLAIVTSAVTWVESGTSIIKAGCFGLEWGQFGADVLPLRLPLGLNRLIFDQISL